MERDIFDSWQALVANLGKSGETMDEATRALPPEIRADGFRALVRALSNQLSRLEHDEANPELTPFNLWRQKFYMDNPDCRYWVADLPRGGTFQIEGDATGAAFVSLNVYAGAGLKAKTVARLTSDELKFDGAGRFSVTLGGEEADATGQWLPFPEGAKMVWLRQFFDATPAIENICSITRLDPVPQTAVIDAALLTRRLGTMATVLDMSSKVIAAGAKGLPGDVANSVREWSEMQGGAVYTEPGIFYQRGAWDLQQGDALVLEGKMVPARHMSVLLYSPFLNSLDYRTRQISLTGSRIKTDADGNFRLILSGEKPDAPNWLDTEGRQKGIFVIRWLQSPDQPILPAARVERVENLRSAR